MDRFPHTCTLLGNKISFKIIQNTEKTTHISYIHTKKKKSDVSASKILQQSIVDTYFTVNYKIISKKTHY